MSMDDDRRARAGDYVLGLMDEAERSQTERDMESDPALRQAVESLASRMHRLDADVAPDPVPAGLWDRISALIDTQDQLPAVPPDPSVVSLDAKRRQPWSRQPRSLWGAAAMAASLALAVGIGYFAGVSTTQQPVVVVVLQTPANETGAVFEAYADNSVRIVPFEDFEVPDGKIMQVWTLYDKAVGPVSLGTLSEAKVAHLKGEAFPVPVAGQLYEITLEPSPGSPTGKPTGPILVKGFAKLPVS